MELQEAFDYYGALSPNLADEFLSEVFSVANRISDFPKAWQSVDAAIRRCQLGRFPYALIYAANEDDIVILSVTHLHRRPEKWRNRLRSS
jgi:plasmid stabilization system protein ParE